MNARTDIPTETRADWIADHVERKAAIQAHDERRFEELVDYARSGEWHTPMHINVGDTYEHDCGCVSTATSDDWDHDEQSCGRGRAIYDWQSTPRLYSARRMNYDGAPDSRCPLGFGRTKAEARADLVEQECERSIA